MTPQHLHITRFIFATKRWRCGGSLLVHQTSEAEVPGSHPASLTIILMRCRIIANNVEKSQGREGNLPQEQKKNKKNICKKTRNIFNPTLTSIAHGSKFFLCFFPNIELSFAYCSFIRGPNFRGFRSISTKLNSILYTVPKIF